MTRALRQTRKTTLFPPLRSWLLAELPVFLLLFRLIVYKSSQILRVQIPTALGKQPTAGDNPVLPGTARSIPRPKTGPQAGPSAPLGALAAPAASTRGPGGSLVVEGPAAAPRGAALRRPR